MEDLDQTDPQDSGAVIRTSREAKFSIGPWDAGHLGREDMRCQCRSICNGVFAGGIAQVFVDNGIPLISEGGNDCPPLEEAIANMHLIAASPDLYEALMDARDVLRALLGRGDESALKLLRKVGDALSLARGEKP